MQRTIWQKWCVSKCFKTWSSPVASSGPPCFDQRIVEFIVIVAVVLTLGLFVGHWKAADSAESLGWATGGWATEVANKRELNWDINHKMVHGFHVDFLYGYWYLIIGVKIWNLGFNHRWFVSDLTKCVGALFHGDVLNRTGSMDVMDVHRHILFPMTGVSNVLINFVLLLHGRWSGHCEYVSQPREGLSEAADVWEYMRCQWIDITLLWTHEVSTTCTYGTYTHSTHDYHQQEATKSGKKTRTFAATKNKAKLVRRRTMPKQGCKQ